MMRLTEPHAEVLPQAASTRFHDAHPETSDPAAAAGPQGIRRRTEAAWAETRPHIEITPRVIGGGGSISDRA